MSLHRIFGSVTSRHLVRPANQSPASRMRDLAGQPTGRFHWMLARSSLEVSQRSPYSCPCPFIHLSICPVCRRECASPTRLVPMCPISSSDLAERRIRPGARCPTIIAIGEARSSRIIKFPPPLVNFAKPSRAAAYETMRRHTFFFFMSMSRRP